MLYCWINDDGSKSICLTTVISLKYYSSFFIELVSNKSLHLMHLHCKLQNFRINRHRNKHHKEGLHGKHTYSYLTVTCVPSIQDFRFRISYRGKLAGCHLCNQKKKSSCIVLGRRNIIKGSFNQNWKRDTALRCDKVFPVLPTLNNRQTEDESYIP